MTTPLDQSVCYAEAARRRLLQLADAIDAEIALAEKSAEADLCLSLSFSLRQSAEQIRKGVSQALEMRRA